MNKETLKKAKELIEIARSAVPFYALFRPIESELFRGNDHKLINRTIGLEIHFDEDHCSSPEIALKTFNDIRSILPEYNKAIFEMETEWGWNYNLRFEFLGLTEEEKEEREIKRLPKT